MTNECHDLLINNGRAAFAYNERSTPWHRLGTPMRGDATLDEMMVAAQANYTVLVRPTIVCDEDGQPLVNPDGTFVYVADKGLATVRVNDDGSYVGLAGVGGRYHVTQNYDVMETAMAIVGASDGDAVVDTVGVMGIGERFFASLRLDNLVLEPIQGDRIESYLNVYTSHDGKVALTFSNSNIRTVCRNTVQMSLRNAVSKFTARHTVNGADFLIQDARRALNISAEWAEAFKAEAQALAAIPVNGNDVTKVLDAVFPVEKNATERIERQRDERIAEVRSVIGNERNIGQFGWNGWALYNGVVEYLDHYRPVKGKDKSLDQAAVERALTTLNVDSWVGKSKVATQAAVLALA